MMALKPCKIYCKNWWVNRQVQLHLNSKYGALWGHQKEFKTFNTRVRGTYLFVQQNPTTLQWYFSWGTEGDWGRADLPDYTAEEILEEFA